MRSIGKKLLSAALCLILVAGLMPLSAMPAQAAFDVWDGSVATEFAGGSGTAEDPYQIKTAAQLAYLGTLRDKYVGKIIMGYFTLLADLDLNQYPWAPIGNEECWFAGTFIGNDHIVKNLFINEPSTNNIGLFGHTTDCKVSGIVLRDAFIRGNQNVGALIGEGSSGSTVSQCSASGTVYGYSMVGGIAGRGSGNIMDCYSSVTVTGSGNYIGGITGYGGSQITRCVNDGKVTASSGNYVGGISGTKGKISDCLNRGAISGANYVSGIVHYADFIVNCGNIGSITSSGEAGGIGTGLVSAAVSNCFNAGMVRGISSTYYHVGAIAGHAQSTTFTNCWNLYGTADQLIGYTPSSSYANTIQNVVTVSEINTPDFLAQLNENLDPYLNTLWERNEIIYDGMPYLPLDIVPLPLTIIMRAEYQNGTVFGTLSSVDPNVTLLCAAYAADGRMLEIQSRSMEDIGKSNFSFGLTASSISTVRLFLLGDQYIPLCESITALQ